MLCLLCTVMCWFRSGQRRLRGRRPRSPAHPPAPSCRRRIGCAGRAGRVASPTSRRLYLECATRRVALEQQPPQHGSYWCRTFCLLLLPLQVCIHTNSEPASAGTCSQVCLELVGSRGTSGPICLDRQASAACFSAGAADVFQLEAPAWGGCATSTSGWRRRRQQRAGSAVQVRVGCLQILPVQGAANSDNLVQQTRKR
jgi:hypothetical protein